MKKTLLLLFSLLALSLIAQQEAPPQGINYQAVVYANNNNTSQPGLDAPGQVLWNEDIGVQFSILSGSASGSVIYKETYATSTDEFGMFDLVIGQGLVQGTQSFNMIDWGSGYHFLKVEVDKTGGTDYVEMSNQQLWSVPYALYSGYSSSSEYADSSAYADIAGNGLTGVSDNGDGTLTFTYHDGSTYTTTVLSGLGGVGPQGPAGADGQDGQDGLSAYEVWLSQGNTGTEQDFLNGLEGPQGPAGTNGVDGTDGIDGQDGQSAYEIWLAQGNTGTEQDFLNGITGPQGPTGLGGFLHYIGEEFGGGVIFHLWKDAQGLEHGLIVSLEDQSISQAWSDVTTGVGSTAQSSWDGLSNSNAIVGQVGHTNSAAQLCLDFQGGGYNDWYLPAIDEIAILWNNRYQINRSLSLINNASQIPVNAWYWSSSEETDDPDEAMLIGWQGNSWDTQGVSWDLKNYPYRVRAIRAF